MRLLTGLIFAAVLGSGIAGARAENANGPDAGIGIPGYNLNYEHSADGSGPGYQRHPMIYQHPHKYSYRKYGTHEYRGY
jgi:hypothetical protein